MYNIKASQNISTQVGVIVKSHIETKGATWLLTLDNGQANDYAQSVVGLIMSLTGSYVRFETVARCIRKEKAALRRSQP